MSPGPEEAMGLWVGFAMMSMMEGGAGCHGWIEVEGAGRLVGMGVARVQAMDMVKIARWAWNEVVGSKRSIVGCEAVARIAG